MKLKTKCLGIWRGDWSISHSESSNFLKCIIITSGKSKPFAKNSAAHKPNQHTDGNEEKGDEKKRKADKGY